VLTVLFQKINTKVQKIQKINKKVQKRQNLQRRRWVKGGDWRPLVREGAGSDWRLRGREGTHTRYLRGSGIVSVWCWEG
jgi:hypothetical protein